jgi:hypothetical protein
MKLSLKTKYTPALPYVICYDIIILASMLLIIAYWLMGVGIVGKVFPGYFSHVSNLCISVILYLGIGYFWLLSGVKFKRILILGAVIIGANVLCETVMGFMNTCDLFDALYGIIGTGIGLLYLSLFAKYGLILNIEQKINKS